MAKRAKKVKQLTHAEKSRLEDATMRQGGSPMLKIPPEALPPELRKRFDEMTAELNAAKKKPAKGTRSQGTRKKK